MADLDDTIRENAGGPAEASDDAGSVTEAVPPPRRRLKLSELRRKL